MSILNFIIAIVALIIAVLAYHKAGGVSALKKQIEAFTNLGEGTAAKASASLRDKTADILGKMESTLRSQEEEKEEKTEKPEPKTGKKNGGTKK